MTASTETEANAQATEHRAVHALLLARLRLQEPLPLELWNALISAHDTVAEQMPELVAGPRPVAHGWLAHAFDGTVAEVWIFGGGGGGAWFAVDTDGQRIHLTGLGEFDPRYIPATKAEAIERVLASADQELTRARAAVDRLRAELASAD